MTLKVNLDSLEGLDEGVSKLYKKADDGSFVLDADLDHGIELKTALQKERHNARTLEKQLREMNKLRERFGDTDPDEFFEEYEKLKKTTKGKGKDSDDLDAIMKQVQTKHQKELEAKAERENALLGSLQREMIDARATSAIAAAKGLPALLLPHIKNSAKVIEENGQFQVRIVDENGTPRVNGKGEYMSISDLVIEYRESPVFSRAFDGTGNTGGGTPPSSGGKGAGSSKRRSEMSIEERSAFVAEHGSKTYLELPF